MRKHAVALMMCGYVLLGVAHGAQTVEYGPAPAWVRPVARPENDSAMAEAPAKVLLRSHQLKFTATGSEAYVESFVRLQTAAGLQAMGNLALPWKPDTDVLTVHKYQLLRGDKMIDILASGQKFEVLRRENNLEYSALDGNLTAALQASGLEVGDVVNFAFTIKRDLQLSTLPEFILSGFSEMPLSRVEVRAIWDKGLALRWRATPEVVGVKESRKGNQVELTWSASNLVPFTQPDNVPLRFWKERRIVFTGYGSWNDISRKLAPLYAKAALLLENSPLKAEAKAIADSTADPVARIEAALRLAQDRVRYVFLGMGDGGLNPAAADETWQRRFGDCKAKSALLIALLRELGIQADAVAVHTAVGDMLNDQLPAVSGFDHVIVRAQAAGKSYWLDGAGSGSWRRGDMALPNYFWGLPLTERGDGLLRMVAAPASEPQVETSTFIDAKAGLHTNAPFTAQVRMRGAVGANLNAQLSSLAPADREQTLRSYWKEEYDFVDVKTVTAAYDEATGIETISMTGTAEMKWGGNTYEADGMRTGARADYSRDPGINVDAPFAVGHPAYSVTKQRIELPPAGTFTTAGKDYDLTLAGIHFTRHSRIENRIFTAEASARSMTPEVAAADARAVEKQLNDMWKDKLEIVSKGYFPNGADVAALRARKFTDAPNLVWRGNILMDHGEFEAAIADFNAALKLDEKNVTALANRGLAHFWRRNYALAKTDLDAALAKDPKNAIALRGLGIWHRERHEFPAAIEKLTASLQADSENTFALSNRAYAYALSDDHPKALADAATAIRIKPTYVDMYDLRAWILTTEEDKTPAVREIEAMLAANPDSLAARKSAARNYSRMGRYKESLAAMDVVVAREPTAENYVRRGELRDPDDLTGRKADAVLALDKKPDFEPALALLAQVHSESGNHQGAIDVYSAQLKRTTTIAQKRLFWTLRGIQYAKAGQQEASRKDFAAVLGNDPDGSLYNNFCWSLATAKVSLDTALAACEKAVALAPKSPQFLDSLGFALLQLKRFDESVAAYDSALLVRPKESASLYGRGLAKKLRCNCDAGDADMKAGRLREPGIVRIFAMAGLTP
jgi:tetratricopeptide (TPR) repeat protein